MKHFVSRTYLLAYLFAIILLLSVFAVSIYASLTLDLTNDFMVKAIVGIYIALGLLGVFIYCYMLLFDFPSAKIYFDKNGIYLHIGFKKRFYSWSNIQECAIVKTNIPGTGVTLYWVYCSRCPLTAKEKQDFLRKTRRNLDQVVFFQYRKKVISDLLQYIPENLVTSLLEQQCDALAHMKRIEKLYHK